MHLIIAMRRLVGALLFLSFAVLSTMPTANSAPLRLTLCGASPDGLWQLLGVGVNAAAQASDPDSVITYQTSSGDLANVALLARGQCDLGIVQVGAITLASQGLPPFDHPIQDFKLISVLYDWAPNQWVTNRQFADQYGITSLTDIAAKKPPIRLVLNRNGIVPTLVAEEALKSMGIQLADVKKWGGSVVHQSSAEAKRLMQDRRADVWVDQTFIGDNKIQNIANDIALTLLDTPADVTRAIQQKFGSPQYQIPANAYEWLPKAVTTNTAIAFLAGRADLPTDVVEQLTAALVQNVQQIQQVHPAMKQLTPEVMVSHNLSLFYPSAIETYKKLGVLE